MKANIDIHQIIKIINDTYAPLSTSCKADLTESLKVLTFSKPAVLVREGQYADRTYFIVKGCARAYYLKDGKDITDWFAFENDFITAINSFFLDVPSPHFIEILEPGILLELSKDKVEQLSDKYHDFERLTKVVVTKTLLQLQQRVVSIQFETALQKYENLLKIRPDITQRIPLTHIASYLGITLETLSRIRNPKNGI
ncbi:Crp/Fnr family transcriptional regulator [Fulvivirga kasyanovii]|uniref:Crp/Fnr family transcriptional regulator n=1 Tax=Fulvivirga kasyanovii TaxID=396812 RepID=A0ABW9RJI4_9BACT|nr:Crp/Fnr family transcriptional regulator [Fulvivirga kasyanovii]MTI24239.1 Crp/Fnr family transcriptional regulator [Fulvivirga kasyanovii]